MRATPAKLGWMPSVLTRPGFPQKVPQFSIKPTSSSRHDLDRQRFKDNMWPYMSSLLRPAKGPEKWPPEQLGVITVDVGYNITKSILQNQCLSLACSFKFALVSPALVSGIHLTFFDCIIYKTFAANSGMSRAKINTNFEGFNFINIHEQSERINRTK